MKLISRQQMGIIRKIAKEQEESFTRIAEHRVVKEMIKNLRDDGYDVSETEVLEKIMEEITNWSTVKENPTNFINILDDINLSMIRHALVNDFHNMEESRPIHRLLNIKEQLNNQTN